MATGWGRIERGVTSAVAKRGRKSPIFGGQPTSEIKGLTGSHRSEVRRQNGHRRRRIERAVSSAAAIRRAVRSALLEIGGAGFSQASACGGLQSACRRFHIVRRKAGRRPP